MRLLHGAQGGEATLQCMAQDAGPALLTTLPKLWEQMAAPLVAAAAAQQPQAATGTAAAQQQQQPAAASPADAAQLQPAVNALHVLRVVGPDLHPDLLPHVRWLEGAGRILAHAAGPRWVSCK